MSRAALVADDAIALALIAAWGCLPAWDPPAMDRWAELAGVHPASAADRYGTLLGLGLIRPDGTCDKIALSIATRGVIKSGGSIRPGRKKVPRPKRARRPASKPRSRRKAKR